MKFTLFLLSIFTLLCGCELPNNKTETTKKNDLNNSIVLKQKKERLVKAPIPINKTNPTINSSMTQNENKSFDDIGSNITEGKAVHPFPSENILK